MLSIVFGLTRFHTYTYGRKVTVYSDHEPLAAVLKKPVEDNPVRLQRMLCRIMGHDVEFKYVKGKDLFVADALSRSQLTNQHQSKIQQEIETTRLVHEEQNLTSNLTEIAEATAKDLNELRPGDTVRVKPEGLLKGQEWKKGTVSQNCGYCSYDVNVDGKLLRRNRVQLKEDQQVKVTEPSSKSGEQNLQPKTYL